MPSTRTPRASGEPGFTLLEVLVAFAVLAIMIVPILQVFGGGLGTTATARGYSTAVLLARSKLAEVGSEENLQEGETTGAFEGYQWRRTISRTELTSAEAEDRDQDVTDSRGRRRREPRSFDDPGSGRSIFGDREHGRSSFSQSRGGLGDRESRGSLFDQRRGGLGRSGQSAFPAGRSGRSEARETGLGDAGGPQSQDLIPYEVTVTVDWGARAGRETLSLSTLRLGRPADDAETSRR